MENIVDYKAVGERIKSLRKENDETQDDLGKIIGLSQNSISKLESGRTPLALEYQARLANHYNVSHDYLVTGTSIGSILTFLEQYISLDFVPHSVGENHFKYPVLKINKVFFNYLTAMAYAKDTKNIPEKVQKQWIDEVIQLFIKNNVNNDIKSVEEIVPVPKELIYPDDNKDDWKQADLLREMDRLFSSSSYNNK